MSRVVLLEIEVNKVIRTITFTVRPICNKYTKRQWRELLNIAIEIANDAKNYKGVLLPLTKRPKKSGNFVYFSIIFKNEAGLKLFLRAIKNRFL